MQWAEVDLLSQREPLRSGRSLVGRVEQFASTVVGEAANPCFVDEDDADLQEVCQQPAQRQARILHLRGLIHALLSAFAFAGRPPCCRFRTRR